MSALYKSTNAILGVVISSVAMIDNRMAKQIPIRETIGGASPTDQRLQEQQRKQRRHDAGLENSSEVESEGEKPPSWRLSSGPCAISDARIVIIRELATRAAIKKVNAAKEKVQATKIAQAKKTQDGTKRNRKKGDVDVSSAKAIRF